MAPGRDREPVINSPFVEPTRHLVMTPAGDVTGEARQDLTRAAEREPPSGTEFRKRPYSAGSTAERVATHQRFSHGSWKAASRSPGLSVGARTDAAPAARAAS